MIDWHEALEPLRIGMNEMFVKYLRDPSILIALILSVPSLILGVVNAFIPRKKWSVISLGYRIYRASRGSARFRQQRSAGSLVISRMYVRRMAMI